MMVVRGDGSGVGAGWSTSSLPVVGGGSGCSTPVDLDELFHVTVGPVSAVPEVMVVRGRGRAGWRSASGGSPTRG